jgi:hypothetical protein
VEIGSAVRAIEEAMMKTRGEVRTSGSKRFAGKRPVLCIAVADIES